MAALDAGVHYEKYRLQHATPTRSQQRSIDRRRENFDRHAAYVVVAFVARANERGSCGVDRK